MDLLNDDGQLDDEEKSKLDLYHTDKKLKLTIFTSIAICLTIGVLIFKSQYEPIPALAFALVSNNGVFCGLEVVERKYTSEKKH